MLKQISLSLAPSSTFPSDIGSLCRAHGVNISTLDCSYRDGREMTMLVSMSTTRGDLAGLAHDLKNVGYVVRIYGSPARGSRHLLVMVLNQPAICRAARRANVLCLNCPLNSDATGEWKVLSKDTETTRKLLSSLKREKVQVVRISASQVWRGDELTPRQQEVITKARDVGYFEFPRKVSLTALARLMNLKPSTLCEILRAAERRIISKYVSRPEAEAVTPLPVSDQNQSASNRGA